MSLNPWILDVVRGRPVGGGYRFTPTPRDPSDPTNPRDPTHDGVSRDLAVGDRPIARAASDGVTYCCGATLEVWWDAWRARSGLDPSPVDPDGFVASWFCPVMGHPGVVEALVDRGLGDRVEPQAARPGDLVQYWRSVDLAQPSGHSAVFLAWEPVGDQPGLRYWSSQPATGGFGERVEAIGPAWQIHLVRAR